MILHEDAHLLFVDKPPRRLTVPAPGEPTKGEALSEQLEAEGRSVFPVHRLDYETSGVVVFAKDAPTRDALVEAFRERRVKKGYTALVQGWPRPERGRLDFRIEDLGATAVVARRGREAITHYETERHVGPCALVRIRLETGRHNQIRLHFAHIGHPLVGERKFAVARAAVARHPRVLLHAAHLEMAPPHLDHKLRIRSRLPDDFQAALDELENAGRGRPGPVLPPALRRTTRPSGSATRRRG